MLVADAVCIHANPLQVRPLDTSMAGDKAYQLLRLRDREQNQWNVVSFTLSQHHSCWLLDSVIVKAK
jgi:hypothetical protein